MFHLSLRNCLAAAPAALLFAALQAPTICHANVTSASVSDAVQVAATVQPTALAGTDAYVSVPDGFDAVHASDAELDRLGFPPRPDARIAPDAYRSWAEAVTDARRMAPALQPVAIHHGPMQRSGTHGSAGLAAATPGVGNSPATSSNWSGFVAPAPAFAYGRQSLTNVYGDWVVPVAQPAFNACHHGDNGADVYSSSWIGIDGSGSGDVLQAGTESDAVCSNGTVGSYQGAWYEWYPYNEVRVTNLVVAPGAAMYVHVWATSATRGHAYIINKTTKVAVSVSFSAPPGVQLIGNSAEWIVERPAVNGTLATLTNYVQEFFANAQATDAGGHSFAPGAGGAQPALPIQMTDDNNQVISVPTLLGTSGIWFSDQGSAQHVGRG